MCGAGFRDCINSAFSMFSSPCQRCFPEAFAKMNETACQTLQGWSPSTYGWVKGRISGLREAYFPCMTSERENLRLSAHFHEKWSKQMMEIIEFKDIYIGTYGIQNLLLKKYQLASMGKLSFMCRQSSKLLENTWQFFFAFTK